jgi:hypothetical protein
MLTFQLADRRRKKEFIAIFFGFSWGFGLAVEHGLGDWVAALQSRMAGLFEVARMRLVVQGMVAAPFFLTAFLDCARRGDNYPQPPAPPAVGQALATRSQGVAVPRFTKWELGASCKIVLS